jgi:hypothetical protein
MTGEELQKQECEGVTKNSYKLGTYMVTYTGKLFYPLQPNIDDIEIKDIAQALSNCCRYAGHVSSFYSVSQHSVLVSYLCEPQNALCGLLHDASEAYLSDIVRPIKYTESMEGYRDIEAGLEKAISEKYSLPYPLPKDVKYADDMVLIAEGYQLFKPVPVWVFDRLKAAGLEKPLVTLDGCWVPAVAKAKFMMRFMELNGVKLGIPEPEEIKEMESC